MSTALGYWPNDHAGGKEVTVVNLGGEYLTERELKDAGLRCLGSNVKVHTRCSIYGAENISIGSNVRIDDFAVIIATGPLTIGDYVHVPNFCWLGSASGIVLEDFVSLAPGVKIFSSSDDYFGDRLTGSVVPRGLLGGVKAKVIVGRHTVVGAGSVILPGVTIGVGCAVGALSLVKNNLEPWGVYAGIPARRLMERKKDLLALEQQLMNREKVA